MVVSWWIVDFLCSGAASIEHLDEECNVMKTFIFMCNLLAETLNFYLLLSHSLHPCVSMYVLSLCVPLSCICAHATPVLGPAYCSCIINDRNQSVNQSINQSINQSFIHSFIHSLHETTELNQSVSQSYCQFFLLQPYDAQTNLAMVLPL